MVWGHILYMYSQTVLLYQDRGGGGGVAVKLPLAG